jgi:hypothetical protein
MAYGALISGVVLALWLAGCSHQSHALVADADTSLVASMTVSTKKWSQGDGGFAAVTVKNVSERSVYLSTLFGWAPWFLQMRHQGGKSLATYRLASVTPDMREAFGIRGLHPGSELRLQYGARLEQRTIQDFSRSGYPRVEGMFLIVDEVYAFHVPGRGQYEIWFEERVGPDYAREVRDRTGVSGVWEGTVRSNRVTLTIP